ncbi:MAG: ribbon-helix-helix domain-containing protein [Actinomycetota bacterium]
MRTTINIPDEYYSKIKEHFKDDGFISINDFILHLIRNFNLTKELKEALRQEVHQINASHQINGIRLMQTNNYSNNLHQIDDIKSMQGDKNSNKLHQINADEAKTDQIPPVPINSVLQPVIETPEPQTTLKQHKCQAKFCLKEAIGIYKVTVYESEGKKERVLYLCSSHNCGKENETEVELLKKLVE